MSTKRAYEVTTDISQRVVNDNPTMAHAISVANKLDTQELDTVDTLVIWLRARANVAERDAGDVVFSATEVAILADILSKTQDGLNRYRSKYTGAISIEARKSILIDDLHNMIDTMKEMIQK